MKKTKEWKPDGYIKSALRKIWRWSPQRKECLKATHCNGCGNRRKELFADHILPVVDPTQGFEGWDVYIIRLFKGALQPLCRTCHDKKSKEENRQRREMRKKK